MELLEIEKELKGAERMKALAKYDRVLVALDARLKEAQRVGLDPETFAKCEPLAEAIVTARKLLRLQVKQAEKTGI